MGDEEDTSEVLYPEQSKTGGPASADATQRLLTALGRFHRYVAKGQAGAPQQFWSDDCMNQLIAAVELSLGQGWDNIVEALTGTARVLHSYELSNVAQLSIPFLNESYEILCLMVGDIIVNNTRSGIMDKWRERYERAVAELSKAGYTLVEDDAVEPAPAKSEQRREVPSLRILQRPKPENEEAPAAQPAKPAPAQPKEPVEDFLPFFGSGEEETPAAEERAPTGAPMDDLPPAETQPEPVVDEQSEPELLSADAPEVAAELPAAEAEAEPEDDRETVYAMDLLCDELARLNRADDYLAAFTNLAERVSVADALAEERSWDVPLRLSRRMTEIVREATKLAQPPDDRFFDVAYAFCEAYVDASRDPGGEMAQSWMTESSELLAVLQAGVAAKTKKQAKGEAAAAASESADGSAESLLETAKKAVGLGDMAGAKTLALQAVAKMARFETEKAETRVRDAEQRFQENAGDIEKARSRVKKAEQEVTVAEGRVAEGGADLADARAQTAMMTDKVQSLEKRVADIEEQIRALEAARDAEQERVREAQHELNQARQAEREADDELDQLREAESGSRSFLESARQQVKELQRGRLDLEEVLSKARETLTHHRASLSDIERTIEQVRPAAAPAQDVPQEDMLF